MTTESTIIAVEYTLTLESGEIIESNTGEDPLVYSLGSGTLLPGLEEVLQEMHSGEERSGKLLPAQGFGDSDPEAFITIPKDHLPPEAWQKGAQLKAAGPQGEEIHGVVVELQENTAVVDFNHPLAGKTILYAVKRMGV